MKVCASKTHAKIINPERNTTMKIIQIIPVEGMAARYLSGAESKIVCLALVEDNGETDVIPMCMDESGIVDFLEEAALDCVVFGACG